MLMLVKKYSYGHIVSQTMNFPDLLSVKFVLRVLFLLAFVFVFYLLVTVFSYVILTFASKISLNISFLEISEEFQ